MTRPASTTFRPSQHGCQFANGDTVGLPILIGGVRVAAVTGGLCGGMVLDSLERWRTARPPASTSSADLARVFAAQLRSFQVPTAPWRYLRLQQPGAAMARRRTTLHAATEALSWLDKGEPVPLALVCRLSRNPLALSAHHIVLAYDVTARTPSGVTFAIYDPNNRDNDAVRLRIDAGGITHSHRSGVRAAFALTAR